MKNQPERMKHDYTSELDLKSMLIRIKNWRGGKDLPEKYNDRINKYIKWYVAIGNAKYQRMSPLITKKNNTRTKLKLKIIELSEQTNVDKKTYEHFGSIILLMIRGILTKPNFSGYTYKTDFYSDAIYKILKYLHNFNHLLISERSGVEVNAFAYISQIIHNSVVFVINTKKQEQQEIKERISSEINLYNIDMDDHGRLYKSTYEPANEFPHEIRKEFKIQPGIESGSLLNEINDIISKEHKDEKLIIYYPSNYTMSVEEYYEIRPLLKNVSIVRY